MPVQIETMKKLVLAAGLAFAAEPDGLVLPPGFHASVVSGGLGPTRHLAVRPNGDLGGHLLGSDRDVPIAAHRAAGFHHHFAFWHDLFPGEIDQSYPVRASPPGPSPSQSTVTLTHAASPKSHSAPRRDRQNSHSPRLIRFQGASSFRALEGLS